MALAEGLGGHGFYRHYKVFGSTNGDSPRSYLLVVRPDSQPQERYGQICLIDGKLIGLRFDNQCYMVHDLATGRFYGFEEVEKLSPFLMLDATTVLNAADVASIKEAAGTTAMGHPRKERLEEAASHPNPNVRRLASEFTTELRSTTKGAGGG